MPNLTPNLGLKKPLDNEAGDIAVINENMDKIDKATADLKQSVGNVTPDGIGAAKQSEFVAHLADYVKHPYWGGLTTNSTNGNTTLYFIEHRLSPKVEGCGVVFKANVDSGDKAYLTFGSYAGFIKTAGGKYPKIKIDGIYTCRWSIDSFILQGEGGAEGNVTRDKVLSGTTYTDPTTGDLTSGTMRNNGVINQTITTQGGQINLSGYVSPGSKVSAQFANLSPENVKVGINIGNVVGTLEPKLYNSGRLSVSGTFTTSVNAGFPILACKIVMLGNGNIYMLSVNGTSHSSSESYTLSGTGNMINVRSNYASPLTEFSWEAWG